VTERLYRSELTGRHQLVGDVLPCFV